MINLNLAKKVAKGIWSLLPNNPQNDRGELDYALECLDTIAGTELFSSQGYTSEKELYDDLRELSQEKLLEVSNFITDKIREKFSGMSDYCVIDDYTDVQKTFWVVYACSGSVRHVLSWFDTEEEAVAFVNEREAEYLDANDFSWYLDVDEEYTTESDLQSRGLPKESRRENRKSDDFYDDSFDWDE